jgi:hypothetical protein
MSVDEGSLALWLKNPETARSPFCKGEVRIPVSLISDMYEDGEIVEYKGESYLKLQVSVWDNEAFKAEKNNDKLPDYTGKLHRPSKEGRREEKTIINKFHKNRKLT